MDQEDDRIQYVVLINDEEQYSLWRKDLSIPNGWRAVGFDGSKEECMNYVDEVWTDMRPASLRKLAASTAASAAGRE